MNENSFQCSEVVLVGFRLLYPSSIGWAADKPQELVSHTLESGHLGLGCQCGRVPGRVLDWGAGG